MTNGHITNKPLQKLKQLGTSEHFAITDWVPVCDGLLADDIVDNHVWSGNLNSKHVYCPIGADIPERKLGRLSVNISGWLPTSGCKANISMRDEPGNRTFAPFQVLVDNGKKTVEIDEPLPFVAIMVAPPPQESRLPQETGKKTPPPVSSSKNAKN